MRIEYPDYYEKFHCLADACPDTCCKDWEVDVDEDTFYFYKVQEGAIGEKLRKNLKEEGECKYIPLRENGLCPFLTGEHLCELCSVLGEEGMSQTCQEYPRYYMGIGDYEQIDLSLSCMEVGRLLFARTSPVQYIRDEDEEEAWETLSDEDSARLHAVLEKRNALLEQLQGDATAASNVSGAINIAGDEFVLLPDDREDAEILELIPRLEILDGESGRVMEEVRLHYEEIRQGEQAFREKYDGLLQRLFTKFSVYLVYRYTIDSYYEGSLEAEMRLWRRSLRMVLLMCIQYEQQEGAFGIGTMIQLTHRYSRLIEHSDENVDLLKG